jgi:transporter family protein
VHFAPWFWFAVITLLSWGIVGLLQKLSTNHISAESTLIWLVVGYVLLEPAFYPGRTIFGYSKANVAWACLGGLLNTLGAWALFAALKCGGKASVVVPLTALYPLPAILLVPLIFHESITLLQVIGILCSLVAVVLLSSESEGTEVTRDSVFPEALR